MKKSIVMGIAIVFSVAGCGGGGGTTPDNTNNNNNGADNALQDISKVHKDSILSKAAQIDVNDIIVQSHSLSKENYVAFYKRMNVLRLISKPDLNTTFNLDAFIKNSQQKKSASNDETSRKILYEDDFSMDTEDECRDGGTISKYVTLTGRGHFEATQYKQGDDTVYDYNRCDMGDKRYNGKLNYHVDHFTKFDYTFGPIPLGTLTSAFNYMSIETDTQKVTLNGTIRYEATAAYTPEPNAELTNLEVKYYTVGDFVVTVEDKSTGETTKLLYNGVLEKIDYSKYDKVTDASTVDAVVIGNFVYRKTSDYKLRVEYDGDMATVDMKDHLYGTVEDNGEMKAPHSVGYHRGEGSFLYTGPHTILSSPLADGTVRYILDLDADSTADANTVEGTPIYTLPKSEYNLMKDVVLISFDDCPHTQQIINVLNELGIPYNYVDIYASQENFDIFRWFLVRGVPYVGLNGYYFSAGGYDKKYWTYFLKRAGFDISDADIKQAYEDGLKKSVAMKTKEWVEILRTKPKHTALAIAIDTPYLYQAHWVWDRDTVEQAKEDALQLCEDDKLKRVDENKSIVYAPCKLYSVDGVRQ
ncbi:hypothetical protein [Sulfurovum sp.]|uniref:glutaredoxin family protein n=1 Tax=Sulfurovum sp. TaxID=1969726 RepID=UPI0025FF8C5B|nr:hypothetical protein [Sulfurovum sp.]